MSCSGAVNFNIMASMAPIELGILFGFGAFEIGFQLLGFGICLLFVTIVLSAPLINKL